MIDRELLEETVARIEQYSGFVLMHEAMLTALWDQVTAAAGEAGLSDAELVAAVFPSTVRDMEAAIRNQDPNVLVEMPDIGLGVAALIMLRWARSRKEQQ